MSAPRPHVLAAGIGLTLLGVLLLLDAAGAITLGVGWLAPAVLAVLGATLLTGGLARR